MVIFLFLLHLPLHHRSSLERLIIHSVRYGNMIHGILFSADVNISRKQMPPVEFICINHFRIWVYILPFVFVGISWTHRLWNIFKKTGLNFLLLLFKIKLPSWMSNTRKFMFVMHSSSLSHFLWNLIDSILLDLIQRTQFTVAFSYLRFRLISPFLVMNGFNNPRMTQQHHLSKVLI